MSKWPRKCSKDCGERYIDNRPPSNIGRACITTKEAKRKIITASETWARFSKNLALVLSTSDVMIDLSERPMYPQIGNCDLFSDARRKTCYERGKISITYSKRLSIFPLQTDSNRYPCEFAFPIREDARSRPL